MSWKEKNNHLIKTFEFKDFQKALSFVNNVGELAEKHQHHPDIKLFDYNNVNIEMTTHDEGNKITEKDRSLAKAIDSI